MMNGAKAIMKKYNEVSLILRIVVGLVIGAVLALAVPGAGWVGELGTELAENCAEYLKSHKRWLNYFTFWKQGGKDHTAEQLATEMEGIIEELGNSDQNLVLNKLMDYPVIGGYNQLNANLNGKIGLAFGIFFPIGLPVYLLATYQRKLLRHDIQVVQKTSRELEDMIRNLEIKN